MLTGIKCLVSGFLIYLVLHGIDVKQTLAAMQSANKIVLVLAFSINLPTIFLRTLRWRLLLKTKPVDIPLSILFKSLMVSMFFDNILPSIVGGDAVRIYDSWRFGIDKAYALAVIIIDRLLGILSLILFSFCGLWYSVSLAENLSFISLWIILGGIGTILVLWIIFMFPQKVAGLFTHFQLSIIVKFQSLVGKIIDAFSSFHGRKDVLAQAFVLSLILQAGVIIQYFIIGKALDLQIHFVDYLLLIPLSIFIMMAPVSINAIGVREHVFVFFLSILGVSQPVSIAFAWLGFAFVILRGVLGGLVYVLRK